MKNGTILFEDLVRFLDGFKALNERLGFNVFQGNKYVNIIDDSNPSDIPIRGKSRNHSVNEALKMIYEKLIFLQFLLLPAGIVHLNILSRVRKSLQA